MWVGIADGFSREDRFPLSAVLLRAPYYSLNALIGAGVSGSINFVIRKRLA